MKREITEQDVYELENLQRVLRLIRFAEEDINQGDLIIARGNLGMAEAIIVSMIERKKNVNEKQLRLW